MGKPTMDDVARRAGVSRALVSLALRGSTRVSAASRQAVTEAAEELGYRPNLIARNLASKHTRTIGFIINDLHNPFFPGVADGAKASASELGYRLIFNSAFLTAAEEIAALEMFIDLRVDGIVLTGGLAPTSAIEQAARAVPVAVVSRPVRSNLVDTINNDDRLGSTMAVEHLIELGHREIWHVTGGRAAGAPQRRTGYEQTMKRHGLRIRIEAGTFTEQSGLNAARRILRSGEPVTAVFAGNDLSALGVLNALDEAGLHVPNDISLAGYDNTFIAALGHIGLTSVDQQRITLGDLAIRSLIERIEGGRTQAVHHVVPPTLITRATTAPPTP